MPQALDLPHSDHGPRDAPALVLLHGFPLDHRMWRAQRQPLADAGFRVLVPDLRGHGKAPMGKSATMEEMAGDVLRMCDRAGARRLIPVGLSMGGYVALEVARQAPDRLAGLVLADTRAEADSPEARQGRQETARRVRAQGPSILVESMLPKLLPPATAANEPALVEEAREVILQQRAEGLALALEGMGQRRDLRPLLPDVRVPALVLVGAEDAITPPDLARAMAQALARARLEVLPLAGHLSPLEAPEPFNAALLGWLRDEVGREVRARRE